MSVELELLLQRRELPHWWINGVNLNEESEQRTIFHTLRPHLDESPERSLLKSLRCPPRSATAEDARAAADLLKYREAVFDYAFNALDRLGFPDSLRALAEQLLIEVRERAAIVPCLPAIDFPAVVCCVSTGSFGDAVPASAACLFYYCGISLLDDIVDGDLEDAWQRVPQSELIFASAALFSGAPATVFNSDTSLSNRHDLLFRANRWLHEASLEVNIGQYLDVSMAAHAHADVCDTEAVVLLKTGSTGKLSGRLGAAIANCSEPECKAWSTICSSLYASMQIGSDIQDVWCKPISPDLTNGTLTLPILHTLRMLPTSGRARFLELLTSKSQARAAHDEMRSNMEQAGSLRFALMRAEVYRARANTGLATLPMSADGKRLVSYILKEAKLGSIPDLEADS